MLRATATCLGTEGHWSQCQPPAITFLGSKHCQLNRNREQKEKRERTSPLLRLCYRKKPHVLPNYTDKGQSCFAKPLCGEFFALSSAADLQVNKTLVKNLPLRVRKRNLFSPPVLHWQSRGSGWKGCTSGITLSQPILL